MPVNAALTDGRGLHRPLVLLLVFSLVTFLTFLMSCRTKRPDTRSKVRALKQVPGLTIKPPAKEELDGWPNNTAEAEAQPTGHHCISVWR